MGRWKGVNQTLKARVSVKVNIRTVGGSHLLRVVQTCRFDDHVDDSSKTTPRCNVQRRAPALLSLLDISTLIDSIYTKCFMND